MYLLNLTFEKKLKNLKNYYYKNIIIFLCFLILFYQVKNSYSQVIESIKFSSKEILLIFFFSIIFYNLINIRHYFFLKKSIKYFYSYLDWSKLFFESLLLNIIFSFSGTLYRFIELKKRGVKYEDYIPVVYLLFASYVFISLALVIFELIIYQKNVLAFFLILITFFFIVLFFPAILVFVIKYFFKNINLSRYSKFFIETFNNLKKNFLSKQNLTLLFFSSALLHLCEIFIFYLVFTIFVPTQSLENIFLFFSVNFILDRVPFISNLPGLSEVILGLLGLSMGIIFIDIALVKLTLRFSDYFSIIFNNAFYYICYFFLGKNLYKN